MTGFFITKAGGCTKRGLDSERIRNYLLANGLEQARSLEEADCVIVTTCGLSEFHENDSVDRIQRAQGHQARTIVYGCLPSMNAERLSGVFDGAIVHTQDIEEFDRLFPDFAVAFADVPDANYLIEEMGVRFREWFKRQLNRLDLYYPLQLYNACLVSAEQLRERMEGVWPRVAPRPFITRIPVFTITTRTGGFGLRISDGCLGNCSYCNIRTAIGRLRSKPIPALLEELGRGLADGKSNISVLSSDTGSYGLDIGCTLPELLGAILDYDEAIVMDFVEDLHPVWVCRYQSELIELVATKRIKSMLIPVQSGSARVLRLMRRSTNIEAPVSVIREMKRVNPRLRLRGQVILGFPTETEEDFQATVDLVKRCQFDEIDIFQYFETDKMDSTKIEPKIAQDIVLDRIRRMQTALPRQTITHPLYQGLRKK
ncbi:MAG: radical SAM protein [Anaerolineae bacterium]|jgi:tRNA A37 methylthiotransferase MiaB